MSEWSPAKIAATRAMANQTASPAEAETAKAMLLAKGIPLRAPRAARPLDAFGGDSEGYTIYAQAAQNLGRRPYQRNEAERAELDALRQTRKEEIRLEREIARTQRDDVKAGLRAMRDQLKQEEGVLSAKVAFRQELRKARLGR